MKSGLGAFRKVRGELPAYLRELGIEIGERREIRLEQVFVPVLGIGFDVPACLSSWL